VVVVAEAERLSAVAAAAVALGAVAVVVALDHHVVAAGKAAVSNKTRRPYWVSMLR